VSLMMEGMSYIAGTEIPCVIVDVMRGGPGLGNIAPSQGDYNQVVHGGGHGDYHPIVLAPATVQEAIDLTVLAFDLAEKYQAITVVLADGNVGQIMEPAELPPSREVHRASPSWALTGADGRPRRILTSIYLDPYQEEVTNRRLQTRWLEIQKKEVRFKTSQLEDAEIVVVAFGTAGRVALSAVHAARALGLRAGLFRPVSLSPFPYDELAALADWARAFLVVEMNAGQMLEDVRLAVQGKKPVGFYGRMGGVVPFPDEIQGEIQRVAQDGVEVAGDVRAGWLERLARARQ